MADKKITDLPNKATPALADIPLFVDPTDNTTKRSTFAGLFNLFKSQTPATKGFYGGAVYFTANGSYVKPEGLKFIVVEVVGGGGGSGGCAATGSSQVSEAGAGGGGGYSRKKIPASSLAASETVIVGAGGVAAPAGNNSGGNGGASSFGSFLSASGGGGGGGGSAGTSGGANAGTGGAGSSGDINIDGGVGGNGRWWASESVRLNIGGSSMMAGSVRSGGSGDTAGSPGQLYGGGASGPRSTASLAAKAGAPGANGIVIIHEYFE